MRYERLFLPLFAACLLQANSFNGEVSGSNTTVNFGLTEKNDDQLVGLISHKKLFDCKPALNGVIEYEEKSLLFYTKDLHAGVEYTCNMNGGVARFSAGEFKVSGTSKLTNDRFILKFNDEPKEGELEAKLKVKDANFSVESASKRDFYIVLDKNISEPEFALPKNFQSKFGAKFSEDVEYKLTNSKQGERDDAQALQKFAKASTMSVEKISGVSLEGGKLGARIYLKDWLYSDAQLKKYVNVSGVQSFKLSDIRYLDYLNEEEKKDAPSGMDYYIDVISDEFVPQKEYDVKILPGFGDSDAVVRSEKKFSVKMPSYAPFAKFLDDKPYISSVGEIGFKGANVGKLKVVVEKISDQNFRYFLNFGDKSEFSDLATEVASKIYDLSGALNEIGEYKIKLDFAGAGDGAYKITAYYDKDKSVSKIVYLSDVAITAKVSKNEIFVFANRLGENTMLANANVKIYGSKNEELAFGATNDEGAFRFEKKDIYKQARSVVVSLGKEQNFLILGEGKNINEDAKISTSEPSEIFSAFTHFATNIVRPGENIKGVSYVKDRNFKPLANMPVKLKLTDPQGKLIAQTAKKTDDVGAFDFDEEILSDLTGAFNLEIIYADKVIAKNAFYVESFVPARLKNEIVLEKDSFLAGDFTLINLSSSYLIGGAASRMGGNIDISFFDYEYKNENFKGYSFKNSILPPVQYDTLTKQIKLDENGKWQEPLGLEMETDGAGGVNIASIVKGVINFSVNDDGKNVSAAKDFTVFPYENVVGVAVDKNFIEPNEKIKIKSVALKSISGDEVKIPLKFEVKRQIWDYSSDDRGVIRWHSSFETVDTFATRQQSFEYSFAQSGNYVVVATDPVSGASASIELDVSGWNYSTLTPTKDIAKAQIKLNKKFYKKGDELSADVSSAIKEGIALVTLEDNGVKAYKIALIKNNSANVKFPLNFDFSGLYASVTIFRLADGGVAPFRTHAKTYAAADKAERAVSVAIDAPQTVRSNQNVKISVKTAPNADVSIFAVDLGVLNITNQSSPSPLKFFDVKLADGVFDYDLYDELTGYKVAGKTLNFGGDTAMMRMSAMLEKHDSLVDKKNIKTFALAARVKADANGEANYEFKTPSGFNSAIRVDAIAATATQINAASSQVVVKDDVVVKPSVLAYLLEGDEIEASLRLINTTAQDKNITIAVKSSENLELTSEKNVTLKAQENKNLRLLVKAKERGKANFEILADDGSHTFSSVQNLDVIPPYPLSTYAKSLSLSSAREFKLPKGFTTINIDASTSASSLLTNLSKNLISYPYGCAEQRASKLLALLNAKPANDDEAKDRERFIKLGISELLKMQKKGGFFGYWNEMSDVNLFASIYAADVLSQLDKGGFKLDANTKKRIINGLSTSVGGEFAIYALYVKAKLGSFDRSEINQIYDAKEYKRSALSRYLMAATLKMAGLDDEAKSALKNVETNEKYGDGLDFGSQLRDKAFVLYLHASYFEKNEFSDALANSLIEKLDSAASTQERAFVLQAIRAYFGDDKKPAKFKLSYDGKTDEFEGKLSVGFTSKDGAFKIEPQAPMFISVSSNAYVPLQRHKKEPRELDIYRTFVNENGKEINLDELKIGDKIFSKVELSAKSGIKVGVINEITSACFEAINENLSPIARKEAVKNSLGISYQTIKDDRVISFYKLDAGEQATIYTPYRVVLGGKCALAAVISENMYNETQTDYDLAQKSFNVK